MPNQKQIRTNDLTAGATVLVRGRVTYSHIASHIDGAALDKVNADAIARGRPTHNRPFTTITICNASVMLPSNRTTMTLEEQYVQERLFESKSAGYTGKCYQAESKSPNLPPVAALNPNTGTIDPVETLNGELAKELDVTLIMEAFDAKPNKGFGLQSVIVNEPIRYFSGRKPMAPVLAQYGYNLSAEMTNRAPAKTADEMPMPADNYPDTQMPPAGAPVPPPPPGTDPYAAPGYPPQAAPAPGYPPNAYGAQPPVAAPQPAPTAAPQPAPAPAYAPNAYGTQPPAYAPGPAAAPAPGYPGAEAVPQGPFAPQGYPDPAAGGVVAGYPDPNAGGMAYSPNNDPGRQY